MAETWYCSPTGYDTNDGTQATQGSGTVGPRKDIGYALTDMQLGAPANRGGGTRQTVEASGETGILYLTDGIHANPAKYAGHWPARGAATQIIEVRSLNLNAPAYHTDVERTALPATGHGKATIGSSAWTFGCGATDVSTRLLLFENVNVGGYAGFAWNALDDVDFINCHRDASGLGWDGLGTRGGASWSLNTGSNVTITSCSGRGGREFITVAAGGEGGAGSGLLSGLVVTGCQGWCIEDAPVLVKVAAGVYTEQRSNQPTLSDLGGATVLYLYSHDPVKHWYFGDWSDAVEPPVYTRVANTNAVTISTVHSFNGASWDSQTFTDNTLSGGKTMATAGTLVLTTVPSNQVPVRASNTNILGANKPRDTFPYPGYWLKVTFSGALSAGTTAWVHQSTGYTDHSVNKDGIRLGSGAAGAIVQDTIVMGAGQCNFDLQATDLIVRRIESYSPRTAHYKSYSWLPPPSSSVKPSSYDDSCVFDNCLAAYRICNTGNEWSLVAPYQVVSNCTSIGTVQGSYAFACADKVSGDGSAVNNLIRNNIIVIPAGSDAAFGSASSETPPTCNYNLYVEEGAESAYWYETDTTVAQAKLAGYGANSVWASDVDAIFTDFAEGDFSLLITSPALDIGTTTGIAATDLRGLDRNSGTAPDAGAIELQVAVGNYPPSAPTVVSISPAAPTTAETLTASASGSVDPEGDTVTYQYQWRVSTDGGLTYGSWAAGTGTYGQTKAAPLTARNVWQARAYAIDVAGSNTASAWTTATPVTVANNAPTAPSSCDLDDYTPDTSQDIVATAAGSTDADTDPVTYVYKWATSADDLTFDTYGGTGRETATLSRTLLAAGAYWRCRAWANDGYENSASYFESTSALVNTPTVATAANLIIRRRPGLSGSGGRLYTIIDLRNPSGVRLTREFYSQDMTGGTATALHDAAIAALIIKRAVFAAEIGPATTLPEYVDPDTDIITGINA